VASYYEDFSFFFTIKKLKKLIQKGMTLIGAFNLADYVPWLGAFDLQVCMYGISKTGNN
jgi:hypothetical protein